MINDKLREIREQTGLNKKRFAEFIGIKYTTYNLTFPLILFMAFKKIRNLFIHIN